MRHYGIIRSFREETGCREYPECAERTEDRTGDKD